MPSSPAFRASRLTPSTFVIQEYADSYDEHPLIYAKICAEIATLVIIDTGCGGATKDLDIDLKSLRKFIEAVPVEDNNGEPLNKGSEMRYVVVLSHCHYDHILGVEEFAKDSQILASGHSSTFLDPDNLPAHSLCKFLDIPVPSYKPILVPHEHPVRMNNGDNKEGLNPWTGLRILHTPGHTPDELAVWDSGEHMLYVGDTLYEWAPIIFPAEGSITTWIKSVDELLELISGEGTKEVKVSCGHVTAARPAREVITGAKTFIVDVLEGREPVRRRSEKRGEAFVEYVQDDHRFSLGCPERLVQEAQQALTRL
ncbi:Metallo-hydrolase/oxidoreductase [Irpex rosettiformis]|uniref:Metallo-hydrolase/oxidoreductase n=1 Tax=Irpex rosettiformis TaxID=378272 RepID=A0ACB8U7G3_9APHY|nr:Metallo-hydrolase/oxidoreductase [Irpex rosettiformis]